jgi:uncharacterized protein YukE
MIAAAAVLSWSGAAGALVQDLGQQLQLALQEANNLHRSIDVEVAKLGRLVAAPDARDHAKERTASLDTLKSLATSLNRNARKIQEYAAATGSSTAARSSIVNGYASEFYAGNRIEFEKAVNTFPLKAGRGDAEAMKKLSAAAANLKKAASETSVAAPRT